MPRKGRTTYSGIDEAVERSKKVRKRKRISDSDREYTRLKSSSTGSGYTLRSRVVLSLTTVAKKSDAETTKNEFSSYSESVKKEELSREIMPGASIDAAGDQIKPGENDSQSFSELETPSHHELITATLNKEIHVNHPTDKKTSWISGIAILKTGQRLFVDRTNSKLKLYSSEMERLASLSLPEKPSNVCMFSGTEALVTAAKRIFVVDINIRKNSMSLQRIIDLDFSITRIAACRQNVFLTTNTCPPEVRKINLSGDILWSAPNDEDRKRRFTNPKSIVSYVDGKIMKVAVLDVRNAFIHNAADTLTIIDGATGEILKTCQLEKLGIHHGLTYDSRSKHFYISHPSEGVINEMTSDLSKEYTRFSTDNKVVANSEELTNDLFEQPYELAFDHNKHQLIVSNEGNETYNEIQVYDLKYEKL